MTPEEFAARLVAIEHRLDEVNSMVKLLFRDVLDSLDDDGVE